MWRPLWRACQAAAGRGPTLPHNQFLLWRSLLRPAGARFMSISVREIAERQQHVKTIARAARVPSLNATIDSLGYLRSVLIDEHSGAVTCQLDLPTPKFPFEEEVKGSVLEALRSQSDLRDVDITISCFPGRPQAPANAAVGGKVPKGLRNVSMILAVTSCKGGVGKSTVALGLASSLSELGLRVGIFDADIFGPSLPTLIGEKDPEVWKTEDGGVEPLVFNGMKCMSYGFVAKRNARGERGGVALRGPMVSSIVQQLATLTEWGELDVLVVDFPPGTGDIQITLGQTLATTGAVVVTTPQALSAVDARKGIDMFNTMRVPTFALVENMSHFDGDDGKRYYPFGQGATAAMAKEFQVPEVYSLPITPSISQSGDDGRPVPLGSAAAPVVQETFQALATGVFRQAVLRRFLPQDATKSLTFNAAKGTLLYTSITTTEAKSNSLSPKQLRLQCRCAACVDEFTGEQLLQEHQVPSDIKPLSISPLGNMGIEVTWSGGHKSIYSFAVLDNITQGQGPGTLS